MKCHMRLGKKISAAHKGRKGQHFWYTNGEVNIVVVPGKTTIPEGFVRGRTGKRGSTNNGKE